MKMCSNDINFISDVTDNMKEKYINEDDMWKNSKFYWIKNLPSRTIGAIGEKIVEQWLTSNNFSVKRSPDSEADRIVNEKRVEIKFSTLWKGGFYKFQQIRNQNYDFIILFGLSPNDCHCWVMEKKQIMKLKMCGVIEGQHTGSHGNETSWIQLYPNNKNDYFKDNGNTLSKAISLINKIIFK